MTHHIGTHRTTSLALLAVGVLLTGCPSKEVDRCAGANPDPECGLSDVGPAAS